MVSPIPLRSWRSALTFAVVLCSAVLTHCSKFEAIHPDDKTAIVYIVNPSPFVAATPVNVSPLPLPTVPRGSPRAAPLTLPPGAVPEHVVEPNRAGLKPLAVPPTPDGEIDLAPLTQTPFSSVGRLEFNLPGDKPGYFHWCTAQLIGNLNVLLTAGHCVYDGGWASNISFKLDYNNGAATTVYGWQCAATVSGWASDGLYPFDFALILLRQAPPAGQGMDINIGATHVTEVGYPNNYYNGEQMVYENASKNGQNPSAIASKMGHGASGGAWFINTANGYSAVSVNSFKYDNDPNTMYGPMLSKLTLAVYDFVGRGCLDQVRPSGSPPAAVASTAENPTTETSMSIVTEDVSAASILRIENSDECSCEGHARMTAKNNSSTFRLVGVQRFTTSAEGKEERETEYFVLKPNGSKQLGCIRDTKPGSPTCQISNLFTLESDRRVDNESPPKPVVPAEVTIDAALAVSDIGQCIAKCSKPQPNDDCLDLGQSAIGALAPLGQFTQQVDKSKAAPDGTIIQKKAIVTAYGGDPNKIDDPCIRSDMAKSGDALSNRGLACRIETKTLLPVAGLKTRLTMPAHVRGQPTAWNAALTAASTVPATLFPQKTVGPKIDFSGTNAGTLNPLFAGDVHAVSAVSDKVLVASTSNGCLQGAYKK
ncbi:trypsin-like serine protease [Bradyrhizobium sp. DASA03120]|uniref:trypsin-like serine peptidase n=1 Tax=Bradyrhizobium sp. SMVTL-02 TaxID=3395917 RepID=UPI003F710273